MGIPKFRILIGTSTPDALPLPLRQFAGGDPRPGPEGAGGRDGGGGGGGGRGLPAARTPRHRAGDGAKPGRQWRLL